MRLDAVVRATGKSHSTIYKDVSDRTFPAPIKIGPRAVAWVSTEIEEWIAGRIAQSRGIDGAPGDTQSDAAGTSGDACDESA